MGTATKSALIYCRVSTKGQDDGEDKTSLESQEALCVKRLQELGFTEWDVRREVFSATSMYNRPVLLRALDDLKTGKYGAFIVYKKDRLARKASHKLIIQEECLRYGVQFISVIDQTDNTPEGQLVDYALGFVAEKEREAIIERTLRGKHQLALNGKLHNGGPELYGYRRNRTTRKRDIYEPEAMIVRLIFDLIINRRMGAHGVAKYLNKQGIPPPSAGKRTYADPDRQPRWQPTQVRNMVRNRTYKGETYAWMYQRPANAQDKLRPDYDPNTGRIKRPESDWIRLPDDVTPALVSPDVWERAQAIISDVKGEKTRNEVRPLLLRNFVFCATCGRKMYSDTENAGTLHEQAIYRCSSRHRGTPCGGGRILADELEAWVWEKVSDVLRNPKRVAAELERRRAEGPNNTLTSHLETARREKAKCDQKQAKLLQRFSASDDDSFPWDVVEREIDRLQRQKDGFLDTIAEIERRMAEQQHATTQLASVAEYCARVSQNLDRFGFDEKRTAIEALEVRITGNGDDWHMTGSIPVFGDGISKTDALASKGGTLVENETQCAHGWRARHGQDAAGAHCALNPAAAYPRRGAGGDEDLQRQWTTQRERAADQPPAVSRATPHDQPRRPRRRRTLAAPRRDHAGASRGALPRRAAGVRAEHAGGLAPAAGGSHRHHLARARNCHLPGQLHLHWGDESMSMRIRGRFHARVYLLAGRDRALPEAHQRSSAGSH
jgi:site-specific DNA recombinase